MNDWVSKGDIVFLILDNNIFRMKSFQNVP